MCRLRKSSSFSCCAKQRPVVQVRSVSPKEGVSVFSQRGRSWLESELEDRVREQISLTPTMQLLKSLPGVGDILAIVIVREVGSIDAFPLPLSFPATQALLPASAPAAARPAMVGCEPKAIST